MRKHIARVCIALALCLIGAVAPAYAGLTRHDVLVIANSNSPTSQAVAQYYRQVRNIPASHVKLITCTTADTVDPAEFENIRDQIKAHLVSLGTDPNDPANDPIKAIVLTADIPHQIGYSRERYGAVDSALALMFSQNAWGKEPAGIYGYYHPTPTAPNGYYGDYFPAVTFEQYREQEQASTQIQAFPGFTLMRMLDSNTALAAGNEGVLFRGVRTGGAWTWTPIRDKDKSAIAWRVSSLSVLDSTHAYVTTGHPGRPHGGGTVLATSDGGQTWTRLRISPVSGLKITEFLAGVDFADTSNGWAVGSSQPTGQTRSPLMLKTTDGGSNWQDISANLPSGFLAKGITAADANNVWICGPGGAIYRSTDGGTTWNPANTGAPSVTYSAIWIKFSAGAYRGWAVGNNGTVIRTEDGSTWTVQASGLTAANITDLAVCDHTRAAASYGANSFLLYTQAGGWMVKTGAPAPVVSAASAADDATLAVSGTRHIFSHNGASWSTSYTAQDSKWRLRYLVMRLDGYMEDINPPDGLPDDIKAMIDRAAAANSPGKFVLDEPTNIGVGSLASAYNALLSIVGSSNVIYDTTSTFLTNQNNVMGYSGWGVHDSGALSATTWARPLNNWANGGVYSIYQSTDARVLDRPYYLYIPGPTGTPVPGKLRLTGFHSATSYAGYRLVLHADNGAELASAQITNGTAEIDLNAVSWPADHRTYVQIYFPANDPLHPDGVLYYGRYPFSSSNTYIYDNRSAGVTFASSPQQALISEAIREGASGGVGNVAEPWANYVGQPKYLFAQYARGYTWGEAAYMGIPGLGWQEVALGDPLMAPYATPPSVSVTSPGEGQVVSGTVQVSANASATGASGIEKVEFWLDDDTLLAVDTSAPYQVSLDTATLPDGVHTIEAIALESGSVQNTGSVIRSFVVNNTHTMLISVPDAFAQPDGTKVGLQGKPVTGVFGGFFYIEEPDRTRGIRVISNEAVDEGDLMTVLGTLQTTDGEREILAAAVYAP